MLESTDVPHEQEIVEYVARYRQRLMEGIGALSVTTDNKVLLRDTDITALLQTESINKLVGQFALIPLIRSLVNLKIQSLLSAIDDASIVLTGHTLKEINTSKFCTIYLDVDETEAAERIMRSGRDIFPDMGTALASIKERNINVGASKTREQVKSVHNHIYIDTADISPEQVYEILTTKYKEFIGRKKRLHEYQQERSLDRQKFLWAKHPVLKMIQSHVTDYVAAHDAILEEAGICQIDFLSQVLMSCCAYPVQELCHNVNGQGKKLQQLDLSASGHYLGISTYESKGTFLNTELVNMIIAAHLDRYAMHRIAQDAMNRPSQSPFPQGAELTARGNRRIDLEGGYQELHYHERLSNRPVIARPVTSELSRVLAENYHYLHSYRSDEMQAFGMFLEGQELPFAWVSYSALDRDYKKELLGYYGVESHNVLEMTRAWSAIWAPKNTMSLLFHYSRHQMKELWRKKLRALQADKPLSGIYTTVNPNLNFTGSSFLGASFIPVGLRPAGLQFSFDHGIWVAKTRRQAKEAEQRGEEIKKNALPLLPLNEMLMLFDARLQEQIAQQPLHSISPTLYKHV